MRAALPPSPTADASRAVPRALVVLVAALTIVTAACSGSTATRSGPTRATLRAAAAALRAPVDVATRPPTPAEAALVAARPYTLHEPPVALDPAPLVVLLHGYGANGASQAMYLGIAPVTDARGMLLAIVDGTRDRTGSRFWNATDACCAGPHATVDDSAYLRAVIADVAAHHTIDPKRVYLVGHSNGGFMSYRMACDHAKVVAAIVSLEAATWNDIDRCRPTESVAVLEIHGTKDKTVEYHGGALSKSHYPSAARTARLWARYDGCSTVPDLQPPTPHSIEVLLPAATVTSYSSGCRGNGHVELWTQDHGVHVPPLTPTFADQIVDYLLSHPKV